MVICGTVRRRNIGTLEKGERERIWNKKKRVSQRIREDKEENMNTYKGGRV